MNRNERAKRWPRLRGIAIAMSLSAAAASLKDSEHLSKQVALNREVRQLTVDAFKSAGYTVSPSDANFIFVDIARPAQQLREALGLTITIQIVPPGTLPQFDMKSRRFVVER